MGTWVLMIILLVAGHIATIPGYQSEQRCLRAVEVVNVASSVRSELKSEPKPLVMCVPGPEK
jgi:hypothetical protein